MNQPISIKNIETDDVSYFDYNPQSGCYISRDEDKSLIGYLYDVNSWVLVPNAMSGIL